MSNDIYRILQRFDNVSEGLSPEQERVKQLPALFKPKNTSPQLSGPYPGKNATLGYLVGEDSDSWHNITDPATLADAINDARAMDYDMFHDTWSRVLDDTHEFWDNYHNAEDVAEGDIDPNLHPQTRDYGRGKEENPMRRAVTARIMNRHPEWIMRYGVEALMQAIDDVTEGEEDWEEIGTSDVSAYVRQVYAQLEDRMGSREEMDDRKPFAEETVNEDITSEDVLDQVKKSFADYLDTVRDEVKKDSDLKDKKKGDDDIKAKDGQDRDLVKKEKVKEDPTEEDPVVQMPTHPVEDPTYAECATVKTITLEDGRACEIYGDEQQGFGIRHGGRNLKSRFRDLDQAQLALEMYMARCKIQSSDADYIEEKK